MSEVKEENRGQRWPLDIAQDGVKVAHLKAPSCKQRLSGWGIPLESGTGRSSKVILPKKSAKSA